MDPPAVGKCERIFSAVQLFDVESPIDDFWKLTFSKHC
jgi:hypothetical protein